MSTKTEDKPIAHAGADSSTRCAVAPGSVTYALFKHMSDEHGLTLLESEMSEIVRIVNDTLEARLRWWIANAEETTWNHPFAIGYQVEVEHRGCYRWEELSNGAKGIRPAIDAARAKHEANTPVTDAEPSTPASTRAQGPRSV